MKPVPLVSIIVRTKDRPAYLKQALQSITEQSHSRLEVVVVNDGGADVAGVTERFDGCFERLLLEQSASSRGRSAAANCGLDLITGEFAGFLDDDDYFEPRHVETLVDTLSSGQAVLAYGRIVSVSDEPGVVSKVFAQTYDAAQLLLENYIPIHAALFRTGLAVGESACRFDPAFDLFEDWDFWLQIQQHGHFTYVDVLSGYYRSGQGSGEGVVATDEARSRKALRQVLEKWQPRWDLDAVTDMVARARFLERKLQETESLRVELDERVDQLTLNNNHKTKEIELLQGQVEHLSQVVQGHKVETKAYASQVKTFESQVKIFESQVSALELKASRCDELLADNSELETRLQQAGIVYEAEIARLDAQLNGILSSNSWAIMRPLRVVRRLLTGQWGGANMRKMLLRFANRVYRAPLLQPLMRLIPFLLKQQLRNFLHRISVQEAAGAPVVISGGQKKVSIIIPVYNHTEYIEQCIDSALAQTYEPLEVVIYDDASPDAAVREILQRYEANPRCRVIYGETNGGIAEAQNHLLAASVGDVIAFLDCDDYLEPEAVDLCMADWRDDTVYLHTARVNVDPSGVEINRISFEHLPRENYFKENLERMFATHFKLIRRDAFARVGLFDPRFDAAQDYDMLMRVAFHYPTEAFRFLPAFVYHHRLHDNQTTESMSEHQQNSTDIIQAEARLRRSIQEGSFDKFVSIIMLSYGKREQTLAALESLRDTVNIEHEIILFDNGSEKATVDFIREHIEGHFDNLKVIYNDSNLGPAQGRKEALTYARGEWFIVFDNDELAEPGWLEELLVRASTDESIGAVCCKVVFPDETLQFSGGYIEYQDEQLVSLELHDRGKSVYDLSTAYFRECDWCPIGATLFTLNPADFLHEGYPNVFEDAGVSMALRRIGKRLVNSPASWVWHEHIMFQKKVDMHDRYLKDRYNPAQMMISLRSFYQENGLLIHDEYIWRENGLNELSREDVIQKMLA